MDSDGAGGSVASAGQSAAAAGQPVGVGGGKPVRYSPKAGGPDSWDAFVPTKAEAVAKGSQHYQNIVASLSKLQVPPGVDRELYRREFMGGDVHGGAGFCHLAD